MNISHATIKPLMLTLMAFLLWGGVAAQQGGRDSLQLEGEAAERVLLKDSLAMSDSLVTDLFELRGKFFRKSDEIYHSASLSFAEQQQRVQALRQEHVEEVRSLLGEALYTRYLALVEERMKRRRVTGRRPLSLDTLEVKQTSPINQ